MRKYNKTITLIGILSLTACSTVIGTVAKFMPATGGGGSSKVYTRAAIETSGIAAVRVLFGPQDTQGRFYFAQAENGPFKSYGEDGRTIFVLHGGLMVEAHSIGNDLLGVKPNPADPIMNQRPIAQWPSEIERTYRLPGEGVEGNLQTVKCSYAAQAPGNSNVFGKPTATSLVTEKCAGGDLNFENSYMVGANGFIWKSEQWVGKNPIQAILEIIEPLE